MHQKQPSSSGLYFSHMEIELITCLTTSIIGLTVFLQAKWISFNYGECQWRKQEEAMAKLGQDISTPSIMGSRYRVGQMHSLPAKNCKEAVPTCRQRCIYVFYVMKRKAWSVKCWKGNKEVCWCGHNGRAVAMYATGPVPNRLVFQRQAMALLCPGLAFGNVLISTGANKEIVALVVDHNSMQQSERTVSEN